LLALYGFGAAYFESSFATLAWLVVFWMGFVDEDEDGLLAISSWAIWRVTEPMEAMKARWSEWNYAVKPVSAVAQVGFSLGHNIAHS
jgi:hypothetical protein